jgi:hypothetical protein
LRTRYLGLAVFFTACVTAPVAADIWDEGGDPDNVLTTLPDNELWHGVVQVHDLGALPGPVEDVDYFSIYVDQYHSYEALITGTTGDLNNGGAPDFKFERLDAGGQVAQNFLAVSPITFSRAIAWEAGTAETANFLRVSGPGCGTACTAADQYTISLTDTTYSIPRFNNSGTQSTTLLIQNVSRLGVQGTIWYFDNSGAQVASQALSLSPHQLAVIPTSGTAAGQSGSILVSHNGHYGVLAGKAVALEPATGFTFDTPMTPMAR